MWSALRKLLNEDDRSPAQDAGERRRLAAAIVLLEIARADFDQQGVESRVILDRLQQDFGLDAQQAQQLLDTAGERLDRTVSLHEHVAALNDQLSAEDKRALMGAIWAVAYADGELDPQEEHRARYLSELLHIPHEDFIRQKLAHQPTAENTN